MKIGFYSDLVLGDDIYIDEELEEKLFKTDINCVNLECPLYSGEKKSRKRGVCLYSKASDLNFLKKYNFKIANLANNHMMDFGKKGLEETLERLERNEIDYFGAGMNEEEAYKPYVLENSEEEFVFWGFAWKYTGAIVASRSHPGVAGISIKKIKRILAPYKEKKNKIAYFHFGTEFEDIPEPYLKRFVEELLDEGFLDIVIGNHPHCIQGIYRKTIAGEEKRCFYSLGNFVLPECEYYKGALTYPEKSQYGYGVIFDSVTGNVEIVPYLVKNQGTSLLSWNDRAIYDMLEMFSVPLSMGYEEYREYYIKNRNRVSRPVFVYNDFINSMIAVPFFCRIWVLYYIKLCCKVILKKIGYEIVNRKIIKKNSK